MSHVFISYSHDNKDKLDILVAKLESAGFRKDDDFWYDDYITAGSDWRDEIEGKLKEAYAVVVLVSHSAMQSTYVTYEWSWALGNGIQVVPLLIEDVPIADVHARLRMLQIKDGIHDINDDVPETLRGYSQISPEIVHISKEIQEDIRNTRVMTRVSLWLYGHAHDGKCDEAICRILMGKTPPEIEASISLLTKLLIDASHSFASKQKRKCRELIKNLRLFWEMYHKQRLQVEDSYILRPRYTFDDINQMEEFRVHHLEPLFSYFTNEKGKANYLYSGVDDCLNAISKAGRPNSKQFFLCRNEIMRVYGSGTNEADAIIQAIEKVRDSLIG